MKDQYACDIGDFGKYGLLRTLCANGTPRLGMAWWMTPDDKSSNDGKFTRYLEDRKPRLRDCDPELFDKLVEIVASGNRSVAAVCQAGVLPADAIHHLDVLHFEPRLQRPERQAVRDQWIAAASRKLKDAELIFADPDNCLSDTAKPFVKNGPKYTLPSEAAKLAATDKSIVIYHHISRNGNAPMQLERAADLLQEATGRGQRPWTLWYHRGTARGFLISPADRHRTLLRSRLDAFLQGGWGKHGHFEEVVPDQSPG